MTIRMPLGVLALAAAVALGGCGGDDSTDPDARVSTSPSVAVVPDAEWCAGWHDLVALQGQYVAAPTTEVSALLLRAVATLEELGVPESLDPAGYTELTAVLDDVRASVDPSFTPTAVPSEPADVGLDHDHGDGDEGDAEEEHREAPFGTWLADYCAA
jgi:hypothetical protein